jgi:uncharacterized protein involved in exopolysaccharide biosynthesis
MRAPLTYTAKTSFITEGEQPAGRLVLGGVTMPSTGGRGPEFYVELMKSPAILQPLVESRVEAEPGKPAKTLVERYGGAAPGQVPSQAAKEAAMAAVASKLNAKISVNGIVTLSATAEDPRLAAGIARSTLEQIDAFNDKRRKEIAANERRFTEQRLMEVRVELRAAEARLNDWDERNRGGSSPALRTEREWIADVVGVKRGIYSSFVQAYEKAKMDEQRDSPRATILDSALPPLRADGHSVMRRAVIGFFLGAMLAAMVALVREYFARISKQASPEALEFTALREASTERLRRPINAVISTFRRPNSVS